MMGDTPSEHSLIIGGDHVRTGDCADVLNPYDGSVVGRVAIAGPSEVDRAVEAAAEAFRRNDFPQHERAAVLRRAADLVEWRQDAFADVICSEAGKPIAAATAEVGRAVQTLRFSAAEALKLTGETVPMQASDTGGEKLGIALRVPLGVVALISPFNFPLNLVVHKVGPAIAAGNSVVLKPATETALTAAMLADVLIEAGTPDGWFNLVYGSGSVVGNRLVEHDLVRGISFTGSSPVGWGIRTKAPDKKVCLELGSTAPLIVDADGDWATAADKATVNAFSYSGQSCVSVQRIILHESIADRFIERFVEGVGKLKVGDPSRPDTHVGPLINPGERDRVLNWVREAEAGGAQILIGGELVDDGACLAPTVMLEPDRSQRVWCQEVFGPVAAIRVVPDLDAAISEANEASYGLQAGVFTATVKNALKAARGLEFGGVLLNEVPTFRSDQMPYGGVKDSGNSKEGPAYAVRELSELRFLSLEG